MAQWLVDCPKCGYQFDHLMLKYCPRCSWFCWVGDYPGDTIAYILKRRQVKREIETEKQKAEEKMRNEINE